MTHEAEAGLPARAALSPTALYLELRPIGPEQLHDAFMQETVERIPARGVIVEIPRAEAGRVATGSAPRGVIFHIARCGSTLVSQLLKQSGGAVVYSEPLPMNELLLPPHKWERDALIGAIRSLGAAFERHARGAYLLKLSSWNTLYCDLVAAAFPATPWALCIRDPLEVCVSLVRDRPGWLREPQLFGSVVDTDPRGRSAERDVAHHVAAFLRAGARLDPARGMLIHYDALPASTWDTVAPRFGLAVDDSVRHRMAAAARFHSKSRAASAPEFRPDGAEKRAAATPALRRAVEEIVQPEFDRLIRRFASG